jgi:hypothetical protein
MRALSLVSAVLLVLIISQPSHAQGAQTRGPVGDTLTICNAGAVDLDAYLAYPDSVATTHLAPSHCHVLGEVNGPATHGVVGFGFPDTKGQWAGARRADTIPVGDPELYGMYGTSYVLDHVNQPLSVPHGAARVSVRGLLSYSPLPPTCTFYPGTSSHVASLPITATPAQVRQAQWEDIGQTPSAAHTICSSNYYALTVIPYPETLEVGLDLRCDPCESPEERRAAENAEVPAVMKALANLPGAAGQLVGGAMVGLTQRGIDLEKIERAKRAEISKGPYQMNWKDLAAFYVSSFNGRGKEPYPNRQMILRGTISRVQVPNPGARSPWVYAYFQDVTAMAKPPQGLPGDYDILPYVGQERAFGICSQDPTIFTDIFGANYGSAMVGKTVEMEGQLNDGNCGTASGIKVTLARQLKIVAPGMPMAKGRPWVAGEKPSPNALVAVSAPAPMPAPIAAALENRSEFTRAVGVLSGGGVGDPLAVGAMNPGRPESPRPAEPAYTGRDPFINSVLLFLKNKTPEIEILFMLKRRNVQMKLTGADRAELEDAGASEKLLEAMVNPASIGPEVTAEAARASQRARGPQQPPPTRQTR